MLITQYTRKENRFQRLRKSWIARLALGREENDVRFLLNRVLIILFGNCGI